MFKFESVSFNSRLFLTFINVSKLAEHFEQNDKQNRMINLEPSGSRMNRIIEYETTGDKKKTK